MKMPMNLQLFAEPGDPDGADQTPVQTVPAEPTKPPASDALLFTQAEMDAKITSAKSQAARNALDQYLKAQGVDKKTLEALITAHKQPPATAEDNEPSEDVAAQLEDIKAENAQLRQQLAAMGKGIPADRVPQYAKLAETYMSDETDFDAALDKALEAFPLPRKEIPKIVLGASNKDSALAKDWKKMSLGERSKLYRENPDEARALAKQAGEKLAE